MKKFLLIGAFLGTLSSAAFANGDVVADLSSASIAVNTGFTGTTLTVFGVLEGRSDVAISIEGPDAVINVRRKAKHFSLWVPDDTVSFDHAPRFYALALSKPDLLTLSQSNQAPHGLALAPQSSDVVADFQTALLRIQEAKGLYNFNAGKIQIKSGRLFRADFELPVNVPIGVYRVHIAAIRDGVFVAARALPLTIDESGVAALVQRSALEHPFSYAFVTLALVLAIGGGTALFSIVRKGK